MHMGELIFHTPADYIEEDFDKRIALLCRFTGSDFALRRKLLNELRFALKYLID